MTDFLVYDVFTEAAFGGNQLAVIPRAEEVPEAHLQAIAREFNFSETVFLYRAGSDGDADRGADGDLTARLRIFTPTQEIPFAGHPTIGAAVALADMGEGPEMRLGLGVGPLNAVAEGGAAQFTTEARLEEMARPDPALVARALGLAPNRLVTRTHAPVMATLGLPFTFTELADRDALAACLPDIAAFREGAAAHPASLDFAQFAYVREGDRVRARMFAPLDNIPEDPATGSACATLAALLSGLEGKPLKLRIDQGVEMGRPSRIEVAAEDGRVTVRGRAVRVMEGRLHLPRA